MARSRLSYADAVKLLIGGEDPAVLLGRFAGGAMLLAGPFAEGVLSWFDYKGEANNLLRELVGRAPARIRSTRGRRHYELIEGAESTHDAVALYLNASPTVVDEEDAVAVERLRRILAEGGFTP